MATTDSGADLIDVPLMGESAERGIDRVRRSRLTSVIQARLEEILDEAQTRLKKSGFDVAAGRRAVLTGGGSQLPGVREVTARVTGKQVRIGRPQAFQGIAAAATGPAYATALGTPDLRGNQSAGDERSKSSHGGEDGTARSCTLAAAEFVRMRMRMKQNKMGVRGVLVGRREILGLIHGGTT